MDVRQMIGIGMIASAALAACGGTKTLEETGTTQQADSVGGTIPELTGAQLTAFASGEDEFQEINTVATGLGPVFNEKSCGGCHAEGALGGAGTQVETRAGRLANGIFDPLISEGGPLFQRFGIGGQVPNKACTTQGEVVPADANVVAGRRTIPLFGLGLVDATPDATFQAIAASQPVDIRGTAPLVSNILERLE